MPKSKIIYNKKINDNYFTMSISGSNETLKGEPGNFIMLKTNKNNLVYDPLLRRSFAVSNIEDANIVITYKVLGKGTLDLTYYNSNDYIETTGLIGNSFSYSLNNKNIAIIAGGIGIAPFPLLFKKLLNRGNKIDIHYGGKSKDDIILLEKFKAAHNIIITTEDGSMGNKGLITDYINKEYEYEFAFVCGPNAMMRNVIQKLNKTCEVQVSMEERMACGIGICMGCIVNLYEDTIVNKKCCKDGPIFDGRKVIWQKL
jgi:dihydroorotate dehydrogenase electron transfer subunit